MNYSSISDLIIFTVTGLGVSFLEVLAVVIVVSLGILVFFWGWSRFLKEMLYP